MQFYYLCLACLLGVIFLIWRIVNSRFGLVVQGLRSNEQRMQAIGFPAKRYKLVCFVIAGTMCGLAGALLANNTDFVSPAVMYWTRSGDLMVMVILGGMGSLFGPVIGAVVYLAAGRIAVADHRILGADHGPAAAADRAVRARRHHGPAREALTWLMPCSAWKIWCAGSAAFVATDHVSLDVAQGELHAIIGPNGAGKTTLISQFTGHLAPHAGSVFLGGRDITTMPAYRRSALGLARSFQITSLLPDFTAADNVALAAQAHARPLLPLLRQRAQRKRLSAMPRRPRWQRVGLGGRADVLVSRLSHGEQRELELAVALATKPQLLLLDEPMAGLGVTESARMVKLLQELRKEVTIVLVEHDMEAVFALADRISVLVYGRVIASGAPAEIRQNEEVKRAYLGDQHVVVAPWLTLASAARRRRHRDLLRPEPGAVRPVAVDQERRDGLADGPQRHGQDHDHPLHHGADAGPCGRDPLWRRGGARVPVVPDRASSASASCRRAARSSRT